MKWLLAILGTVGLYFLLTHWHVGEGSVAFNALGMAVTWFAILFVGGTLAILKSTVMAD